MTRLLAPTLPFATEEAWRWWHHDSVHTATWPATHEPAPATTNVDLDAVSEVLGRVRRTKTEAKLSQRAAVERLALTTPGETATDAIEAARADLVDALTIRQLTLTTGDGWIVDATMAPPDA